MPDQCAPLLERFEALDIDAAAFGHREHVQVAFEMLLKYPYTQACTRYANTIRAIASKAGAPGKFHVTITFAWLSVVAERIGSPTRWAGFDEFIAANGDLLSKSALRRWYSDEQLQSEFARTHFLLPDAAPRPASPAA